MAATKKQISLVITFHNEGVFAYRTIRNVLDLLIPVQKKSISYEVIFHLDNGDNLTRKILKSHVDNKNVFLYENKFENPSDSRNFAAQKASGEYVALIDGDDIMSINWLIDGYEILSSRADEDIILHAERNITFGDSSEPPRLWHMSNSRSEAEDTLILFTRNRWAAGIFSKKSIIKRFQYKKATGGFGYEDWTYNMDTRYAGVRHEVVPGSVQFYRIKAQSVMHSHDAEKAITDYTELFSIEHMHKIAAAMNGAPKAAHAAPVKPQLGLTRRVIRAVYNRAEKVPVVGGITKRYLSRKRRNIAKNKLGDKLREDWNFYNRYDGDIYINNARLASLLFYSSEVDYLGHIYCKLMSQVRKEADYVFMPWQLSIGGTEKLISNYLKAFAEIHPDWHIVVLSSITKDNPYNIPDNVDFVDFHGITRSLSDWDRDFILSRLIVHLKAKRLHIIHDTFAYQWAKNHIVLLKSQGYDVYLSHFMHDYTEDPFIDIGLIDPYISNIYPAVKKIFADNQPIVDEMHNKNGFELEKMSVHYQPLELEIHEPRERTKNSGKIHILWASRVSLQKRPDILKNVALKLDPEKYIIDVYGRFQDPYDKHFFDGVKTINYKGAYSGISSIDMEKYDVFLYTSQTDGLPNVLLEIMALGLPIVASDVGGVSDIIIHNKTGYLVDFENADEYIKGIETMTNNSTSLDMVRRGQKIIKKRHTWKAFMESASKDIS